MINRPLVFTQTFPQDLISVDVMVSLEGINNSISGVPNQEEVEFSSSDIGGGEATSEISGNQTGYGMGYEVQEGAEEALKDLTPKALIVQFLNDLALAQFPVNIDESDESEEELVTQDLPRRAILLANDAMACEYEKHCSVDVSELKEADSDNSECDTESFFSVKEPAVSPPKPPCLSVRLSSLESSWHLNVDDGSGQSSQFSFPKETVAKTNSTLEVKFKFGDDPKKPPQMDIHLGTSHVVPSEARMESDKEVQTVVCLGVENVVGVSESVEIHTDSTADVQIEIQLSEPMEEVKKAVSFDDEVVVREIGEEKEESSVDLKIRSVQERLEIFGNKISLLSDIVVQRQETEVGSVDFCCSSASVPEVESPVPMYPPPYATPETQRGVDIVSHTLRRVELEIAPLRKELINLRNKMLAIEMPPAIKHTAFLIHDPSYNSQQLRTYSAAEPAIMVHYVPATTRYTDSLREFYRSIGYVPRYRIEDDARSSCSFGRTSLYEDARSTCSMEDQRRCGDWGLPSLEDMYSRLVPRRTSSIPDDARSEVSTLSSTSTIVQARYPRNVKRRGSQRPCLQDPMWSEPEDILGDFESSSHEPWISS